MFVLCCLLGLPAVVSTTLVSHKGGIESMELQRMADQCVAKLCNVRYTAVMLYCKIDRPAAAVMMSPSDFAFALAIIGLMVCIPQVGYCIFAQAGW